MLVLVGRISRDDGSRGANRPGRRANIAVKHKIIVDMMSNLAFFVALNFLRFGKFSGHNSFFVLESSDFSVTAILRQIVNVGGTVDLVVIGSLNVNLVEHILLVGSHVTELLVTIRARDHNIEFLQNVMIAREVVAADVSAKEIGKKSQNRNKNETEDRDWVRPDIVKDVVEIGEVFGHARQDPEQGEEDNHGSPDTKMNDPDPPLGDHGNLENHSEETTNESCHSKLEEISITTRM